MMFGNMNPREQSSVIQRSECNGYVKMGPIEGCLGDFSTFCYK
jgi:hypothetical protein